MRLPCAAAYIIIGIIGRVDDGETLDGQYHANIQGNIRAEACEWLTKNGLS